jgi:hypothetical protein
MTDGEIGARTTRSAARDLKDDALAALRALAFVELARRGRRGGWQGGSTGVVTSTEGGGEVMRTHAPPDRAIDGRTTRPAALGRSNDVLAARRLLAVVELARRSRRGDGRSGSSGAMTQDEAHRQRRLRSSHDMTSGGPRAGLDDRRSVAGFPARGSLARRCPDWRER